MEEILAADIKAEDWLAELRKTENFALTFPDPPVNLGKYYNNFCSRNTVAYTKYKT